MNQHIDQARAHLGDLAAMSHQTEAMERKILGRAEKLLAGVERGIDNARTEAMTGDDAAKDRYSEMVMERGRLQQVIAQARSVLVD